MGRSENTDTTCQTEKNLTFHQLFQTNVQQRNQILFNKLHSNSFGSWRFKLLHISKMFIMRFATNTNLIYDMQV